MSYTIKDIISTEADFREIMGQPNPVVIRKTIDHVDDHCRNFIAHCPFIVLASADNNSRFDASPRGDPAGFVKVLDNKTLVIPDRPGNRRADTMSNLITNPNIGILFLIPGINETLRISGEAFISVDRDLLSLSVQNGKAASFVIIVRVKEAFFHCAKSIIRSQLWNNSTFDVSGVPSLAQAMVDHGKLKYSYEDMQQRINKDEQNRLY